MSENDTRPDEAYVEPTLELRQQLADVVEGAPAQTS